MLQQAPAEEMIVLRVTSSSIWFQPEKRYVARGFTIRIPAREWPHYAGSCKELVEGTLPVITPPQAPRRPEPPPPPPGGGWKERIVEASYDLAGKVSAAGAAVGKTLKRVVEPAPVTPGTETATPCPHCGKVFKGAKGLQLHLDRAHPEAE